MKVHTIILAAGSGSRMHSLKAKSLQKVAGISMLERIIKTAQHISEKITLVVGHDKEGIINEANKLGGFNFVEQPKPNGTGDAVKKALPYISDDEIVLVLYGDVPLIKASTLTNLINSANTGFSILTSFPEDPFGYGRVTKDSEQKAISIIEEKDANDKEKQIKEIFSGNLCINGKLLRASIDEIKNENAAKEYYLTDLVSINSNKGVKINTYSVDINEVLGANSKKELELIENINREMQSKDLQEKGVTIVDSKRVDIRGTVVAGKDCYIDVNVILEGEIILGDGVEIGPNTYIKDTKIGSNTCIKAFSFIEEADIGSACNIGPYARIREGSEIGDDAKVGNFVEVKNSTFAENSKANHLSYIGDSSIGTSTNIGAGTITCNYDGANKFKTIIGDNVFIGSNSTLVAPLTIEGGGFVAAGSTITQAVPKNNLAVGRGRQRNIVGWKRPMKQNK